MFVGRAGLVFFFMGLPFGESPVRSIASVVRRKIDEEKLYLSSARNILTTGAAAGEDSVVE